MRMQELNYGVHVATEIDDAIESDGEDESLLKKKKVKKEIEEVVIHSKAPCTLTFFHSLFQKNPSYRNVTVSLNYLKKQGVTGSSECVGNMQRKKER